MSLLRFLALGFLAAALLGCGSKKPTPEEEQILRGLPVNAPTWIETPVLPGKLVSVGGSPQVTGGLRFQQIEAAGRAREGLRKQIERRSARAASIVLTRLSKPEEVANVAAETEPIGLMIGAQAVKEFKREAIWWSPSREHYVLFAIDLAVAKKLAGEGLRLYIRGDDVYWDRFVHAGDPLLIEEAVEQAFSR